MRGVMRIAIAALALMALASSAAMADGSVTVTQTPGPVVLHTPAPDVAKPLKTLQECIDAGPVGVDFTCSVVTNFKKVGVCDPPPADANGEPLFPAGTVVEGVATQCPNDATRWYTRVTGFVSHYPSCNVVGLVPDTPPPDCTGPLPPNAWDQGPLDWVPPVDPGGMLDPNGNPVTPPPATP